METSQNRIVQEGTVARYEQPNLSDYGKLVDLTAAGGFVRNEDVPHGLPNSAFPS